ncbi:MAG TPA: YcxB family protein [Terriglobales bacterium]|nr:YcxB family protein [Terriglobales bacterium]
MKIEFELRTEDEREARRAYYQHLRRGFERYLLPVVGLLLIAGPVWARWDALTSGRSLHHLSRADLAVFLEGWFLLMLGWIVAKRGPIGALRQPGRGGLKTLDAGEDGIAIGDSERFAVSSLPWTDFSRFVESKNLFVFLSVWPTNASSLYAYRVRGTPACLYVVPKRAFAAGGVEEFRALLRQHLPGVPARRASATTPS